MSLYKRKTSPYWWLKIAVPGRKPIQRSTGTSDKQKALEYHDKLKAQLWDELRLGIKPDHFWNEAVLRWLNETSHKRSQEDDKAHLRWLHPYLDGINLKAIDRDKLEEIIQARLAGGASNSTVNRTLEVIRATLRKAAFEWEWLDRVPKFRMLPKPEKRNRWLTFKEAERLLKELPDHLKAMVRFSLETGLRRQNVTRLEWSQVDLTRRCAWIHADQAKARKAIPVPLSEAAVQVIREQLGKHDQYVFTYKGKRVTQVNTKAWRNALKRAKIANFRWHDLRHTWASWHTQQGTPQNVLQELGAWSSPEMVRRYAHLSSEHLAAHADRMSQGVKQYRTGHENSYNPATVSQVN